MTTVGIVTNAYEVGRLQRVIAALEAKPSVRVELFVEDTQVFVSERDCSRWDVCFTKGRGPIIQAQALAAEAAGVPTHNCAWAILVTNHRFLTSVLADTAGVPQPDYAFGYERDLQFPELIEKNTSVEFDGKFTPRIRSKVPESLGEGHQAYFQRAIHAAWEYKVHSVGETYRCFKQLPVAVNPNKMASRVAIPDEPLLLDYARRVKAATRLTVTSMDFLKEDEHFYLTDVNSAPNFNYMEDGASWLADWLVLQGRT